MKVKEIVLKTPEDVDAVLTCISDMMSLVGGFSIDQLYTIVGLEGVFEDTRWGWYNTEGITVKVLQHGYLLVLPEPVKLDPNKNNGPEGIFKENQ